MNVTVELILILSDEDRYEGTVQLSRVPCVNEEIFCDGAKVFQNDKISDDVYRVLRVRHISEFHPSAATVWVKPERF